MRNKTRSLTSSPTSPFFLGSASLPFLSLPSPSGAGGRGMGVMVSSSQVVSAAPSSSGGGLLALFPCSSVRSLSRETALHRLFQGESFPRAAALHELPQCGSFPRGEVFQEQAAPAWVPHGVTSPASKPAPAWAPLSTGPQVLAGAYSSVELPTGSRHPSGIHLLQRGVFHRLQVEICSTVDLHGLQGENLPHHGLHHELQCKTLCSNISSTSSASFFTNLSVCRVVSLTPSHSSLLTAVSPQVFFFPFLNTLSQRC